MKFSGCHVIYVHMNCNVIALIPCTVITGYSNNFIHWFFHLEWPDHCGRGSNAPGTPCIPSTVGTGGTPGTVGPMHPLVLALEASALIP